MKKKNIVGILILLLLFIFILTQTTSFNIFSGGICDANPRTGFKCNEQVYDLEFEYNNETIYLESQSVLYTKLLFNKLDYDYRTFDDAYLTLAGNIVYHHYDSYVIQYDCQGDRMYVRDDTQARIAVEENGKVVFKGQDAYISCDEDGCSQGRQIPLQGEYRIDPPKTGIPNVHLVCWSRTNGVSESYVQTSTDAYYKGARNVILENAPPVQDMPEPEEDEEINQPVESIWSKFWTWLKSLFS